MQPCLGWPSHPLTYKYPVMRLVLYIFAFHPIYYRFRYQFSTSTTSFKFGKIAGVTSTWAYVHIFFSLIWIGGPAFLIHHWMNTWQVPETRFSRGGTIPLKWSAKRYIQAPSFAFFKFWMNIFYLLWLLDFLNFITAIIILLLLECCIYIIFIYTVFLYYALYCELPWTVFFNKKRYSAIRCMSPRSKSSGFQWNLFSGKCIQGCSRRIKMTKSKETVHAQMYFMRSTLKIVH